MNIFEHYLKEICGLVKKNKNELKLINFNDFKNITVETPPSNFNFDLSTNISLVLGKLNNLNPKDLSLQIKNILKNNINDFNEIEIAGPGFLNINISDKAITSNIKDIFKENDSYGSLKANKTFNIEFVSANPTGPMHIGHCRGAIFGDVLSNLLIFNGNKVTKEYYVNDYGNQIKNFVKSVYLRIREIKDGEKFIDDKDLYPGEYIIDIAKKILKSKNYKHSSFEKSYDYISKQALKLSMEIIKEDLKKLGITHDKFVSEKSIVQSKILLKAINELKKNDFIFEGYLDPPKGDENKNWKKTKKLIFKSTLFGDDANRALQKDDGSWTYFANDLAYHYDKVSRNYNYLINILGADHTGYINRIKGAVSAISKNKTNLECKVCQLVKLLKKGQPYKMSKRAGEFISVNDLLLEVDKDSIRFMMLNRSNDVELDFDFEKILEKSKENPVYYVQYCHARIQSIFRTINYKPKKDIKINKNFKFNKYEKEIIKKVFEWPKIIKISCSKYEPHRIPFYLYELSTLFHSYWSKGNENENFKFIKDGKIADDKIIIVINLILVVLKNGMKILNVSLPNKM